MVGNLVGKYRLVRKLGEGGMGVVYEAVREDIGGRSALKVLRPDYAKDPDLAARFFNEKKQRVSSSGQPPGAVRGKAEGNGAQPMAWA